MRNLICVGSILFCLSGSLAALNTTGPNKITIIGKEDNRYSILFKLLNETLEKNDIKFIYKIEKNSLIIGMDPTSEIKNVIIGVKNSIFTEFSPNFIYIFKFPSKIEISAQNLADESSEASIVKLFDLTPADLTDLVLFCGICRK